MSTVNLSSLKQHDRWLRFIWTIVLPIGLAALLLVQALQGIDWERVWVILQQANVKQLFLGFTVLTFSYFLRALRWQVLLGTRKTISAITVFWGINVGYLGNAFLPARAGELLRTLLISRYASISKSFVLATVVSERVLDAGFLVVLAMIVMSRLQGTPKWLEVATRTFGGIAVLGIVILLVVPYLQSQIERILLQKIPQRLSLPGHIVNFMNQFAQGSSALQQPMRMLSFLLLTVLLWSTDVLYALIIGGALGLTLSVLQVVLLLAALGLSSAVPSTPGYVGIYQFVAVSVLTPFAFSRNEALVFILVFQAVTYIVILTWGGVGLLRLNRFSLSDDKLE
jgi:hypothetical protein